MCWISVECWRVTSCCKSLAWNLQANTLFIRTFQLSLFLQLLFTIYGYCNFYWIFMYVLLLWYFVTSTAYLLVSFLFFIGFVGLWSIAVAIIVFLHALVEQLLLFLSLLRLRDFVATFTLFVILFNSHRKRIQLINKVEILYKTI